MTGRQNGKLPLSCRAAHFLLEPLKQRVEERIGSGMHRLNASRVIDVRDRGYVSWAKSLIS